MKELNIWLARAKLKYCFLNAPVSPIPNSSLSTKWMEDVWGDHINAQRLMVMIVIVKDVSRVYWMNDCTVTKMKSLWKLRFFGAYIGIEENKTSSKVLYSVRSKFKLPDCRLLHNLIVLWYLKIWQILEWGYVAKWMRTLKQVVKILCVGQVCYW